MILQPTGFNSATHKTRQASARNNAPRNASSSGTRQQNSGANLQGSNSMAGPVQRQGTHKQANSNATSKGVNQPQKLKLIRQREPINSISTSLAGGQRIRSPTSGNSNTRAADGSGTRIKQQANYIMGPASTKHNGKQDFFFSATSPPVQINKQAIQMNTKNQAQGLTAQMGNKQKDSIGHVAAARRQKPSGLQISVDGCQQIVIPQQNGLNQTHIASPIGSRGLFVHQNTPNQQTNPNLISDEGQSPTVLASGGTRRASFSKKQQLRSGGNVSVSGDRSGLVQQINIEQPQSFYNRGTLNFQQFTPTSQGGANAAGPQIGPRSTKARNSQLMVNTRYYDKSQNSYEKSKIQSPKATDSNPTSNSLTIEQQQPGQMRPRMGQTLNKVRQGAMMNAQNENIQNQSADNGMFYSTQTVQRQSQSKSKANNSSLGVKQSANNLNKAQALKIQNMRIYNESAAVQKQKQANSNNYTLRNNFISPRATSPQSRKNQSTYKEVGVMQSPSAQQKGEIPQQPSQLRQFSNMSAASAGGSKQIKKRKLTLTQRTIKQGFNGIRPTSGGQPRRIQPQNNKTSNMSFVASAQGAGGTQGTSTRTTRKQIMQLLPDNEQQFNQTQALPGHTLYSPGKGGSNQGQLGLTQQIGQVMQFYPNSTTNQSAPQQFQFSQLHSDQLSNPSEQVQEIEIQKREQNNRSYNKSQQQQQQQQQPSRQGSQQRAPIAVKSPRQAEMDLTANLLAGTPIMIGPQSAKHAQEQANVLNVLVEGQRPPSTQFLQTLQKNQQMQAASSNQPQDITEQSTNMPKYSATGPKSTNQTSLQNSQQVLNALDPISQDRKDINQKIQQRKVESARRDTGKPNDNPNAMNNLQVQINHEMNPLDTMKNGKYAQTTTNANQQQNPHHIQFNTWNQNDQTIASNQMQGLVQTSNVQSQNAQQQMQARELAEQMKKQQQHKRAVQKRGTTHDTDLINVEPQQKFEVPQVQIPVQIHNQANGPVVHHIKHSSGQTFKQVSLNPTSANSNRTNQTNDLTMSMTANSTQPPQHTRQHSARNVKVIQRSADGTLTQQTSNVQPTNYQQVQYPMTPAKCLKLFGKHLTDYEKTEILDHPHVYYFGEGAKKIKGAPASNEVKEKQQPQRSLQQDKPGGNSEDDLNFGYDDLKGNYIVKVKDHIGYRYELLSYLGKGSFGIAVKCYDHKNKEEIALKIIKNKKKYYYQAGVELKILQYLKENDPDDTMNIIHMKDYVIFRKHLCISFELMSINLYEFLKLNDFEGLSLGLIRRFAIQLLYALKYLKENDVIHCDLKPENILLKDPSKSGIKIIDFGSSCFQDERVYTYIQSRFYRAPEIILGIPYTPCIDMWSFGCIMAEFAMGYPIFPGEDETDQLSLIMECCGIPTAEVLLLSQRKTKFFNEHNMPNLVPNSHGKVRKPGTKILEDVLECSDQSFVNFIERCLEWDPQKRLTPDDAIRHQWILEGLPPKVLIHHQKLHNIPTRSLPTHIREQRAEYLARQPLDMQMEFRDEDEQEQSEPRVSYSQQQHHRTSGNNESKSVDRRVTTASSKQRPSQHTASVANSSDNKQSTRESQSMARPAGRRRGIGQQ